MSARGSITLGELVGKLEMLEIKCHRCSTTTGLIQFRLLPPCFGQGVAVFIGERGVLNVGLTSLLAIGEFSLRDRGCS